MYDNDYELEELAKEAEERGISFGELMEEIEYASLSEDW